MKIKRQVLVDILAAVKPGLAKKAIVEQSTHFVMTGNEVITYNDRICISHPFKTDFHCSVSAEELYKILVGISHEEIDFEFKDQKIHIKGKGFNAGLATDTGENILKMVGLLDLKEANEIKKPLPVDFIEAITMCMFSASKDLTNPGMACLLVENQYVASTDDLRISEYKMKSKMDCSILLPASSAVELVRFAVDQYVVSKDNAWIHFFGKNGVCFSSRLVEADFPPYSKFLEGFDSSEIKLPDNVKQMVETASVLTEGEISLDKEINIEIKDGLLRVKGQNNIGWIESEIEVNFKNADSIQFGVNPFFMLKIMDHTKSMFYGGNKILFQSGEFKHVIALRIPE